MPDITANKTFRKILIPLLIALALNYKSLINLENSTDLVNLIIRVFIIISIILVGAKVIPQHITKYMKK